MNSADTGRMTKTKIDPVTLEILKNSAINIAKEMARVIERIAYNPLFSEAWDFATSLLDRKSELVAQFSWQAAQLGAMSSAVAWTVADIGLENIEPGDILFQNDAYRGGTHVPEIVVTRPIFYKSKLLGFAGTIAHLVDIGGITPGGFPPTADDIYQEGIRIPPVKIWRNNAPVRDVVKIFLNNVRVPRDIEGDLNGMIACTLRAEKRVIELVEKYGVDTIEEFFEAVKDYSERRMRQEIAKIPDGNYVGIDHMDDDGIEDRRFRIKVTVVKKGDQLILDYTGTDPQAVGPINCPYSVTASATYNAVIHLTDPAIPINYGSFRPIKIIAPPGTLVNVDSPGPVNGGHTEFSNHIVFAVVRALAPAIPRKTPAAGPDTFINFTGGGIDPRTREYYAFWLGSSGGWGALADSDGNSASMGIIGNCHNQPIETTELRYPWIAKRLSLRPNSGGAGRFRGGLGTIREYQIWAPTGITNAFADRHKIPPWGIFGGKPGMPSSVRLVKAGTERALPMTAFGSFSPTKFMNLRVQSGDMFVLESPGGGGYGDPLERDVDLVLEDVREEYITREVAEGEYGVVIKIGGAGALYVDHEATLALRRKRREVSGDV